MTYIPKSTFRRVVTSCRLLRKIRGRFAKNTVIEADLSGNLSEKPSTQTLPFSGLPRITLPDLLKALRLGAHDPRVSHFHMRISPLAIGWGKVLEIRRHLEYFRASGKSVTAYIESGGPKEFFLAMGFALYVPPEGSLGLRGFASGGAFVRGVLDKIGIQPQVERIGKYKSAGDSLSRTSMSTAQREVINALLSEVSSVWMKSVCEATGMTHDKLHQFMDKSPWSMKEYEQAGLITGIRYGSEVEDALKKKFGGSVSLMRYVKFTNDKLLCMGGRKRIAVIRAVGAITGGKNGSSPLMGSTVGSESLIKLIKQVKENKRFVGCILRCDSPGGSALASDVIWNELRKLGKVKPLVTSQVDVAASGGYYLSMASEIVSETLTITGSIGVVTAKPSLEEFYKKIGYAKENISMGSKYAELLVDDRPFTEVEASYFREGAEVAYRSFVSKAAMSRSKTAEELEAVAQGRVWTGRQAKEIGLVDHLGGFEKALEVVKEKAGLKKGEGVRLEEVKASRSFRERLGEGMGTVVKADETILMSLTQPLAMSELDGSLSHVSPVTGFVLHALLGRAANGLLRLLN